MAISPKSSLDSEATGRRDASDNDPDILQEEDEREKLLAPNSGLQAIFRGRDPNSPREAKSARKEHRKQKRRDRKAKRRKRRRDEDGELLYEMEEGDNRGDSSSVSSVDTLEQNYPQKPTGPKLLHILFISGAIVSLLGLLLFGAFRMSKKKGVGIPKLKAIRSNGTSNFAATTILISLDGFRADFLSRGLTPTLNAFIAEGVSPKYMLPSFPSVTFPNHYTLVTGLYPESHGVVGNTFWDPILKEEFYYTDPARSMQPKWWISGGAEPLWSTAESQGVRSAIHMWPGSEAHIQLEPTFVDKFNGTEALSRKVDRVLGLLDLPTELDSGIVSISESRPQFIAMYVPDVDQDGHKFGPNSTEITKTITSVDTMLHDFFHGLQQRNLTDVVNVVIVSDHGMATTSSDRLIQLEDLIDVSLVEHIDGWPLFGLRMKADKDLRPMYEALLAKSANNPNIEVYLRENMPKRYHFSKNERIAPLWIIPKTGWAIVERKDFDIQEAKKTNKIYHPRGLHGYDHEHPLMRAIFIARGPAFPHKPNSQVAVFQNTEVYNIVCDSLEIIPHPNNGTLHLPLTPIGVHPGIPDTPVFPDFPPTTVGQSSVPTSHFATISTSIPPVSVGVDIPDPIPIRPVISNGNGPPDDKKGGNRPKTWWQYLVDKLEEGKAWASKLFNELKGEEGQSKKQES